MNLLNFLKKPFYILCFNITVLLTMSISVLADDIDDINALEQDFLFLIEEGYTQEQGEWQIGSSYSITRYQLDKLANNSENRTLTLNIEYGVTDRFQIEFTLPYLQSKMHTYSTDNNFHNTIKESGLEDSEVEVSYQVIKESDNMPAISVGFGMSMPSSTNDTFKTENLSVEGSLKASKYLDEIGYIHSSISYETNKENNETEVNAGVAFVRPFNDSWSIMLEYLFEKEKETELDSNESESELLSYISIGASYENNKGLLFGLAYAYGNDKTVLDSSLMLKIQYEF